MPVTVDSWASNFDAPTTELLCGIGNGRLYIFDVEIGEPGK
jgi:hypothetical protein